MTYLCMHLSPSLKNALTQFFIYYSDMYTFHFHKIASNTTIISIPSPLWAYKSLQIYINLMCRFTFNCSMMPQEKTFFSYSRCYQESKGHNTL